MYEMKDRIKSNGIVKKCLETRMWKIIRPWIYCYGAPLKIIFRDKKKIRKLKNKYKGKRCFIIGNGPSLSEKDLELIKNEYSFGQNMIYKIFPKTTWRPTFYCVQDFGIISEMAEDFLDAVQDSSNVFIRLFGYSRTKDILASVMDKVIYVPLYHKNIYDIKERKNIGFGRDAAKFLYDGDTVTYFSIQLASYMGFEKIYLIGMDFNFPLILDINDNLVSESDVPAHFYETAESYKKKIENDGIKHGMPRDLQLMAFMSAKKYSEDTGEFKIINATRGGKLDVFDRATLEDILKE